MHIKKQKEKICGITLFFKARGGIFGPGAETTRLVDDHLRGQSIVV
jgi:hypothetical protein